MDRRKNKNENERGIGIIVWYTSECSVVQNDQAIFLLQLQLYLP